VEGVTFHLPQIAAVLRSKFVESRVHMDVPARIDPQRYAVSAQLRDELIGSTAMPHYAILDPETGEFLSRSHLHGGSPDGWARDMLAFLERPDAKKSR
jgi:hypothetical protein